VGALIALANIILISVESNEPVFATCHLQVTIMYAVLIQDHTEDGRGFKELDLRVVRHAHAHRARVCYLENYERYFHATTCQRGLELPSLHVQS